jgi:hypothetical protein
MENQSNTTKPYALAIYVGALPEVSCARKVDLTPRQPVSDPQESPIVATLRDSGLSPADLRSRAVLCLPSSLDVGAILEIYATVCGFANRRLDVLLDKDTLIEVSAAEGSLPKVDLSIKPDSTPELVVFGSTVEGVVSVAGNITASDAVILHHARRVRFVPFNSHALAVSQFIALCALRQRGDQERYPILALSDDKELDLDEVRKQTAEMRRSHRTDDRSSIAPRSVLSSYQDRLTQASLVPQSAVMLALGSTTPGGGVWHCPRPSRHTHGDAVPSMRVEDARARCFRCDAEWVDPVRLTADVKGVSFDEAAKWVIESVAPKTAELLASLPPETLTKDAPQA